MSYIVTYIFLFLDVPFNEPEKAAVGPIFGTKIWNQNKSGSSRAAEAPAFVGGPWRTRTSDPLIKSSTPDESQEYQDDVSEREVSEEDEP